MALILAAAAAWGTWLCLTPHRHATTSARVRWATFKSANGSHLRTWLVRAGLHEVRPAEFTVVVATLACLGTLLAFALFGGVGPALMVGALTASWPLASYRRRSRHRREVALDAWPRLIDEIRILTSAAGRSVPQAVLEVGKRAPAELRPAFAAAQREWLLTTDFPRTLAVLKRDLADPTADAACETLLIAHEVGGTDLDRRLASLADDRRQEVAGRKDARAKQAGVRFARRFVLVVPLGMALAGTSVGTGRAAYATPTGQLLVAGALAMVVACWWWSGRLMQLPESERVFSE